MPSEFEFIDGLKNRQSILKGVKLGIGDDCAALAPIEPGQVQLVSTDLLTEGIHFDLSWGTPSDLGRKSVAVNVSDLAAMGGRPVAIFWSLAIPQERLSLLANLTEGVVEACKEYEISLAGGDTSGSLRHLTICHTVIGTASEQEMIKRSGAKSGDLIFCSGWIGQSGLGLKLLKGFSCESLSQEERLKAINAFLVPKARLNLGMKLAASRVVTSMLDVSDGLLQDLKHILMASGVSAYLDPKMIPLSPECKKSGLSVVEACVSGEDYELLFTAPASAEQKIMSLATAEVPILRIGEIRSADQNVGRIMGPIKDYWPAEDLGFRHF